MEAVTARTHQVVWKNGDIRRILEPSRSAEDKVLLLLYADNNVVRVSDLIKWSEYKNGSRMRKTVLRSLHQKAMVHFDQKSDTAQILPPGQRKVEDAGLLELKG